MMKARPVCRSESGWTIAEAMAAMAIISVGLTLSFSVLVRVRAMDRLVEEAAIRASAAERIMEQTIALPFEEVASRAIALAPEEVGGRPGWTAEVRVGWLREGLKAIDVTVSGNDRRTQFRTLKAARGLKP